LGMLTQSTEGAPELVMRRDSFDGVSPNRSRVHALRGIALIRAGMSIVGISS
jgi:hypothetical protein